MAEISSLRRRMIEDMTVRNLSPATQRSYINAVQKFSRHFGRSPDRLDLEDVRTFHVYLVSGGISWAALNQRPANNLCWRDQAGWEITRGKYICIGKTGAEIDGIQPREPCQTSSSATGFRTLRASASQRRNRTQDAIPIVPNNPRLRSIRLM
ncbi:hypothetical protein ACVJBD_007472 [Rhizobium mongolense]